MEVDGKPRFHLDDPGAEGGSGGGGEAAPASGGIPPLPSKSSREKIYDASDAASAPDASPAEDAKEAPPAKDSGTTDADKGKEKVAAEGEKEPPVDKRLKDTQTAFHKSQGELKIEREEKAALKAKLELAGKYVDFDKLAEHDKTQSEADLDQPLTKRDLKVKEDAEAAARTDADRSKAETAAKEQTDAFVAKFVAENPHVKPHVESGAAKGVYEVAATKIWNENPEISMEELMEKAAKAVADHFRTFEDTKRKEVARDLTTRRESLDQGRTPPSGGQPGSGSDGDDVADSPQAEAARRNATRARTFRPTL